MKVSFSFLLVRRDFGVQDILNQDLNPLKSRLSLHCYGTESEEVPQQWILNFSSSIQVMHKESIGFTSSGWT